MRAESKIIPQKNSAPLSPGIFAGIVLGATAVGAGAMVFFFNPSTHGFYPVCMFHALTGLNCPGCGTTRALYALLHGNLLLALKDNALFICGVLAATGGLERAIHLAKNAESAGGFQHFAKISVDCFSSSRLFSRW